MRKKSLFSRGFALLTGIIIIAVVLLESVFAVTAYRATEDFKKANALSDEGEYDRAKIKLETVQENFVVKNLGFLSKKIDQAITFNNQASSDKKIYEEGLDKLERQDVRGASALFSQIGEGSPFYQSANEKIDKIYADQSQENLASPSPPEASPPKSPEPVSSPIFASPEVNIKANNQDGPITVSYNASVNLSWTSKNATSCLASGAWSGEKQVLNQQNITNLTSSKVYTLECTGRGGSVSDSVIVNIESNHSPVANAGPDKEVYSGETVTFAGLASDPDGGDISFSWVCQGGSLSNSKIAGPTFTAPVVSAGTTYFCVLTATDSQGISSSDELSVKIKVRTVSVTLRANPSSGNAPLQGVDLTAAVSGISDNAINYIFYCNRSDIKTNILSSWAEKVDSVQSNSFTAVDVCNYDNPGTYTAKVIAEVGSYAVTATKIISVGSVQAENHAPAANAGPDKEVLSGGTVLLQGFGSDSDGDEVNYSWSCAGGTLSNSSVASPVFIAPVVSADISYACTITVTDTKTLSSSDQTTVTVRPPTLSVTLTANPSAGDFPLYGVDLAVEVQGTVQGAITYKISCYDDNTIDHSFLDLTETEQIFTDVCDYTLLGNHTAKVTVERGGKEASAHTSISVSGSSVKAAVLSDSRLYNLVEDELDEYISLAEQKRGFKVAKFIVSGIDDWSYIEVKNFIKEKKAAFPNLEGVLLVGNIKLPSFYKPRNDNTQVRLFSQYYGDIDGTFLRKQEPGSTDPLCPQNDPFCNTLYETQVPDHDFDYIGMTPGTTPELWVALLPVGFSDISQNTYQNYADQLKPFLRKVIRFYKGQLVYSDKVYKVSNQLWDITEIWDYYGPTNIDFYSVNSYYSKADKPDGCCYAGDYCYSQFGEACYSRAPLEQYGHFQDFWNYYQTRAWMGEDWQLASVYKKHMTDNSYQFVWVNTHAYGEWSIITSNEARSLNNGGVVLLTDGCSTAEFYQPGSPSPVLTGISPNNNLLVSYVYGNSNFIAAMGDPFNRGHEAYYEELIPFVNQGDYLGKAFLKRWKIQYQNSSNSPDLEENSQEMLIGDPFVSF
ncbi:MAG: PKD domain-containing protein [bacterium]